VLARLRTFPVQLARQRLVQDLVDQRALAGAGYAGHRRKHAERNFHVDVFQVVFLRSAISSHLPFGFRRFLRHRDELRPLKYCPVRNRGFAFITSSGVPAATTSSAVNAGARSDVDDVIGSPHRILVMLDDDQRVAQIPHMLQR
jgi:hypothetical protein